MTREALQFDLSTLPGVRTIAAGASIAAMCVPVTTSAEAATPSKPETYEKVCTIADDFENNRSVESCRTLISGKLREYESTAVQHFTVTINEKCFAKTVTVNRSTTYNKKREAISKSMSYDADYDQTDASYCVPSQADV